MLCAGALYAGAGPKDVFQRVELLNAHGASQLALKILDDAAIPVEQSDQWLRAEELRFGIYTRKGDWEGLSAELDRLPAELPLIHQHRLITNAVELLLQSGRGTQSRKYLRDLLWRGMGDSVQVSYWRRLLIRSYLLDGQLDDARIAMDRYQREYAPTDQNWLYLYGLTLLKSGAFDQAAAQFSLLTSDRARALGLLSRLRGGVGDPKKIAEQAMALQQKIAREAKPDALALHRTWLVQAEAGIATADNAARARALEHLFALPVGVDVELASDESPAELWQTYRALALQAGNAHNLLLGDTDAWLAQAGRIKKSDGIRARAIYALLAAEAAGPEPKGRAHGRFYDALVDAGLERVAVGIYTDRSLFPSVVDVPATIRHRIVSYAVKQRDIELAALMARGLTAPYEGQDPLEWKLVRARLAIYSGDLIGGVNLLREVITPAKSIDTDTANRIMQLLFDLQSVESYQAAYDLFELIQERVASTQQKREIYFWMGDSMKGMARYSRAAELYILSAAYGGEDSDMWGQTARYHAADALAQGGMLEDARNIYESLMEVITDPVRAVSLQRKMQDLWLKEQGLEQGGG